MIPSHVLAAGTAPMLATAIVGGCASGLTAVGNAQANALQLPSSNNLLSGAAGAGTGAKLPKCEAGAEVWLRNDGGNPVAIYPFEPAGVTIAGAASFAVGNTKTCCFKALSDTYWAPMLSS